MLGIVRRLGTKQAGSRPLTRGEETEPLPERRVAVAEHDLPSRRVQLRQVLVAESDERVGEPDHVARELRREGVGPALGATAERQQRRAGDGLHGPGDEQDCRQVSDLREPEPVEAEQPGAGHAVDGEETQERHEPPGDRKDPEVAVRVVAKLVAHDRLDPLGQVVVEHGVGHDDAPRRAEAEDRCVRPGPFPAQVEAVQPPDAEAAARNQGEESPGQVAIRERVEPVEERRDDDGRDGAEEDTQAEREDAGEEPPPHACVAQEPVEALERRQPEHGADRETLGRVGEPATKRLPHQAVPAGQHEAAVQRRRQPEERQEQAEHEAVHGHD